MGCINLLLPLGEPHTQYGNMLTATGAISEADAKLLRMALFQCTGNDTVVLRYVPQNAPLHCLLGAKSAVTELADEAAQYDLLGFAAGQGFEQALTTRRRQTKRRAIAALQADGPLHLEVFWPGHPGYDDAVHRCIAWKEKWIAETSRISAGLEFEGHATFLASLPGGPGTDGGLVIALYAGNRPVAYQLGFIQHKQYYLYTASFDWDLRRWSLGTVLIDLAIEWLIGQNVAVFDLMGNPSPYKKGWTNQPLPLSGHVVNLTWSGAAYSSIWVRQLRPTLKAIYHRLPATFRRPIAAIRAARSLHPHTT